VGQMVPVLDPQFAALSPNIGIEACVVLFAWFLGGVPWGAVGIGGVIVFTLVYHIMAFLGFVAFDAVRVAILSQAGVLAMTGLQVVALRNSPAINWRFTGLVALVWTPFDILGMWLLFRLTEGGYLTHFQHPLGALILLAFLALLFKEVMSGEPQPQAFDMRNPMNVIGAVAFAVAGGLCAGFFSIPIVAFVVFSMITNMPKEEWRASVSPFYFTSTLCKVLWLFFMRKLLVAEAQLYLAGAFGALLGVTLGNAVTGRVNDRAFRVILLIFLLMGSLSMMGHATVAEPFFAGASAIVLMVGFGCVAVALLNRCIAKKPDSKLDNR